MQCVYCQGMLARQITSPGLLHNGRLFHLPPLNQTNIQMQINFTQMAFIIYVIIVYSSNQRVKCVKYLKVVKILLMYNIQQRLSLNLNSYLEEDEVWNLQSKFQYTLFLTFEWNVSDLPSAERAISNWQPHACNSEDDTWDWKEKSMVMKDIWELTWLK